MLTPLTSIVLLGCAVLALLAVHRLLRRRLIDDVVLYVGALTEGALIAQLFVGLARSGAIADGSERATFIAYIITVLVIIPVVLFIAIKEKTQWAMAVVLGGAATVTILVGRLMQIWSLHT